MKLETRDPSALRYTAGVIGYSALGSVAGVGLILQAVRSQQWLASSFFALFGVLLCAHARVVASYMVHEAGHNTVFKSGSLNAALGVISLWLCGSPYGDFLTIRDIHIAHHVDRADTLTFDYRTFLKALPKPALSLAYAMEWAYIPAVEYIHHLRTALWPLNPLVKFRWQHRVTAAVGTAAVAYFFAWLFRAAGGGVAGLGAVALYVTAVNIQLHTLMIHDCFQHTYTILHKADDGSYTPGPGDRTFAYEQQNTYSDLISTQWPSLNILALNFGYHNAHHKSMMVPWYKLHELHMKMYDGKIEGSPQVLPLRDIIQSYHRYRLRRVLDEDYGKVYREGEDRARDFVGADGVSFLTVGV